MAKATRSGLIGPLRHKLSLEAVTTGRDEGGGAIESWTELARLWGAVDPSPGTEPFQADARRPTMPVSITVRSWPGLTPGNRLRLGNRIFSIVGVVDPDGRGRFLTCTCTETM
jgi:SPP1 family predicted phage head-tail adaptor